jgi:cytochrome P450
LINRRSTTLDDISETIGGYRIPRGDIIFLFPYLTHRLSQFWPEADRFDPMRFLGKDPSTHRQAYIPFLAGQRTCIGMHFSIAEMMVVLALVGSRFRFELDPTHAIVEEAAFTLRPRFGVRGVMRAR